MPRLPWAGNFDPIKYAGQAVRIVLVDRERDDLGLRDKKSELEAAAGLKIEIMALAALKNMTICCCNRRPQ